MESACGRHATGIQYRAFGKGEALSSMFGTVREQACAIVAEIERNRRRGILVDRQVVLAPTHRILKSLAGELADLGVRMNTRPDLWGEDVVQDLLAVVARGRVRDEFTPAPVAPVTDHTVPKRGRIRVRAHQGVAGDEPTPGPAPDPISPPPRTGGDSRNPGQDASAAELLREWLFERSDFLGRVFREADAVVRNRKLAAIHHLLRITEEHEAQGDRDHSRLIARVRRAGGLRQSTAFGRATPPVGEGALRAMTINAARGESFEAVYLAGASASGIRLNPLPSQLAPPSALADLWDGMADLAGAETALFRVGVSRATRFLHLSGPRRRHVARTPGVP